MSDLLPDFMLTLAQNGEVNEALAWCQNQEERLLVFHEAGEMERATEEAQEELMRQAREERVDVYCDGDTFEVECGDYHVTYGVTHDRRHDAINPSTTGRARRDVTDTEFEVSVDMFGGELSEEARRYSEAEHYGEAARDVWARTRGV